MEPRYIYHVLLVQYVFVHYFSNSQQYHVRFFYFSDEPFLKCFLTFKYYCFSGTNAITYLSGYLIKKCFTKHCCDICIQELVNQQLTNSGQLLCLLKGYVDSKKTFGGLITPSDKFVDYITGLEATFVPEFENNVSKLQIQKYLLSKLPMYSLLECAHFPSAYLLKIFVRMRIHYALKFGSRQLGSEKKK